MNSFLLILEVKIFFSTFTILNNNDMTHTEKYIVDTYSGLFDGLNSITKLELLEKLAKSIRKEPTSKEKDFFKSFGAFASDKTAEEIVAEIKDSRKFREKNLTF